MKYVLSLSYGKDSLACLGAIEKLGLPLDRIIHVEVWATDTIPADLPPMVEFKKKADKIIKDRYGIVVEHISAMRGGYKIVTKGSFMKNESKEDISADLLDSRCNADLGATNLKPRKWTYEDMFYQQFNKGKRQGEIYGFPILKGNWCNSLKKELSPKARWCSIWESQ